MFLVDVPRVRIGSSKLTPAELSTRRQCSRVDLWRHCGGTVEACPVLVLVDLRWAEAAQRQNAWHRSDIGVLWTIRTHVTWRQPIWLHATVLASFQGWWSFSWDSEDFRALQDNQAHRNHSVMLQKACYLLQITLLILSKSTHRND